VREWAHACAPVCALACAHYAAPAGARILREIYFFHRREKSKKNGRYPDTSKKMALFGADTKRNGLLYADTSKKEGEFPRKIGGQGETGRSAVAIIATRARPPLN
jgi:hypothetical protein